MKGCAIATALVSLLAASELGAQGPGNAKDLNSPGPEHRQLDPLAGKWDVVVKYRVGNGKEQEGKAECQTKWVLDGRFLEQRYESQMQGKPFTVLQYLGYDRRKGKVVEIKMDSMDTSALHNEGTISADGKTISCFGERFDPATGKVRRLRTVTTLVDQDHYTLEWFSTHEDGKEERAVLLSHTRKSSE